MDVLLFFVSIMFLFIGVGSFFCEKIRNTEQDSMLYSMLSRFVCKRDVDFTEENKNRVALLIGVSAIYVIFFTITNLSTIFVWLLSWVIPIGSIIIAFFVTYKIVTFLYSVAFGKRAKERREKKEYEASVNRNMKTEESKQKQELIRKRVEDIKRCSLYPVEQEHNNLLKELNFEKEKVQKITIELHDLMIILKKKKSELLNATEKEKFLWRNGL